MTWQEWLCKLLILIGLGGGIILLAEALCGWLKLDRKRPESQEFSDADADALVAAISREIEAEAATIAKREVRR